MSYEGRLAGPTPNLGQPTLPAEAIGVSTPPSSFKGSPVPRNLYIGTGAVLLAIICLLPISNALALLQEPTYTLIHGSDVPNRILLICLGTVTLYGGAIVVFLVYAKQQETAEQMLLVIVTAFVAFLGLALMLVSMSLSQQAMHTYSNLMFTCDSALETRRLYEYSEVLLNIRAAPDCHGKYSVEECPGYDDAPPYTETLKAMEDTYRCIGFYHGHVPVDTPHPSAASSVVPWAGIKAIPNASAAAAAHLQLGRSGLRGHTAAGRLKRSHRRLPGSHPAAATHLASVGGSTQDNGGSGTTDPTAPASPRALFSDATYREPCERLAARDVKNFAGEIAAVSFYQGLYLEVVAAVIGLLKLTDSCVRKDREVPRAF